MRFPLSVIFLMSALFGWQAPNDARASESPTVLVFGDSLAAGYGIEPEEAFPALLQKKIESQGWNFTVQNAGVSGDTSAGGVRRINWTLKKIPTVMILELGGNDGLRGLPLSQTRTNLQKIVDVARRKNPQLKIIVAGMKMPPNLGADYSEEFEKIFPELAQINKAALVPFLLEGVGGVERLNQADRIHPTPEGHARVAENVWRVLKPILADLATIRSPN
jgi:acyl-CoA thioesterase-1